MEPSCSVRRCSASDAATLQALVNRHVETGAAATVLTATVDEPTGYGRIERRDGSISAIVEHKDASPEQRQIREINSGIYAFDLQPLFASLKQIGSANAQGDYLPDLVTIYRDRGLRVETLTLDDAREILGVNSRELAQIAAIEDEQERRIDGVGVTIVDPATAYIGPDVAIAADTIIHPNVSRRTDHYWLGLRDSMRRPHRQFGAPGERLRQQLLRDHRLAHRRRGSDRSPTCGRTHRVGEDAHVGNFVELKKTRSWAGLEGQPPRVSRRRGHRRERQHRRRHDHLQLRRQEEAPDDDRGWRVHRQRFAARRAGHHRRRRLRRRRIVDYRERPAALAISRGKQINKEGWVDRKKS